MRTRIKTMAIITAVASSALFADAQQQDRPQRTGPKPAGFNCPVCGSPCISKAQLIMQHRMQGFQSNAAQRKLPERPAMNRQDVAAQAPARQQRNKAQAQRVRQQRALRFDIDGNGQLSTAERAALRAYRDAAQDEQDTQRGRPDPQLPVGE